MTHPLTPRDKVARIVDPWAFSIIANITQTERAADNRAKALTKADAIIEAIAPSGDQLSGNPGILKSDDHAELARLADDLRKFEHHAVGSLKIDMGEARRIIAVCDAHIALLAENAALRAACSKSNDEISQTLGKALGYPWFKDDQINFPGATAENGVCVGDHVAESLADEAARRLTEAERKLVEADKCARSIVAMEIPPGDDPEQRMKLLSMLARAQVLARTFLSKEAERG